MDDNEAQFRLVEKYLDEIIQSEREDNYDMWLRRFDPEDYNGPSAEVFHRDVREMHQLFGEYQGRTFLACLQDKDPSNKQSARYLWKGEYQKKEILMDVRVQQKAGVLFLKGCGYSC